jgi:hypothetical protein
MEASSCFGGGSDCNDGSLELPVLEYPHTEGRSVTGGYRYRGDLHPTLRGVYLYADYVFGTIWGTVPRCDDVWQSQVLLDTSLNISTFGEGVDGELYLTDYSSTAGAVYRIAVAAGSGGPEVTVDPTQMELGPGRVGDTGSAELLLTNLNTGPEALLITGISIGSPSRFAVNVNGGSSPCGSPTPCLDAGQSCTLEVTFSSPSAETVASTLAIAANAPTVTVPLTGIAYEPCSVADHRELPVETVTDTRTEQACRSLTAGPYTVASPGDVTLVAGEAIVLGNGFTIGSGASLEVAVDPLLTLP